MNNLKLLCQHFYYETIELLRQPSYVVSTLIFPSMFFWFFGVPNAQTEPAARLLTGSFAAFALLGVVLFQFGIGIANERSTPWSGLLRVLPMPGWIHMTARLSSALFFSALAIGCVFVVSAWTTPAHLPTTLLVKIFMTLLLCGVPFGLLGFVIGLMTDSRSALPVANLVYLPLSFAGGLWMPPNVLPTVVQKISLYLPTRHLGEIVWAVALSNDMPTQAVWGLIAYGFGFGLLALILYRRDFEKNYA